MKNLVMLLFILFFETLIAQPLKIAHLSDLHVRDETSKNYILKVIEEINEIAPDVTLVSGDLTQEGTDYEYEIAMELLSKINGDVLFVHGNHDNYTKKKEQTNFVYEKKGIWFIGIDPGFGRDWKDAQWKNPQIDSLLAIVPTGADVIVLSHYPFRGKKKLNNVDTLFKDYNVLMVASGHYHANTEIMENQVLYTTVAPCSDWREMDAGEDERGFKYMMIVKVSNQENARWFMPRTFIKIRTEKLIKIYANL